MMLYRQSSAPAQARFQRRLQPGRNQEVNSRLQMKANELERLFAEHKRRARAGDHCDEAVAEESLSETTTATTSSSRRGELYERYMRKRESKLRMESGAKKEERAATMKALRESLESSSAELKLLQNPRSSAAHTRDQLEKKNFSEEEEEEEQSDTSYKSVNSKLLPTKRTMSSSSSSSVGRNSNSSLNRATPRPSAKATAATGGSARGLGSGSGSGSSDTRKENTKPPPSATVAASKPTTNFPRSKSSSAGLSSSSTPSRKLSATPLKPLTVLPKEQSGGGQPSSTPRTKEQNPLACISEAALHDVVDVSSPTASTASSGGRTRKKWASDASCQPPPRNDTGKGIKRFLQFGRRKKPGAGCVDAECSPAGARDDWEEDGTAASEEVVTRYRRDGFSDHGAIALEQVQTRGSSMAAVAPANCKLKEDHQSPRGTLSTSLPHGGSSPLNNFSRLLARKGVPRSFFSLPPFRNREGDSKIGR